MTMTKVTYQYAIVQFMPFVETGEFANVGVVLIASQLGFAKYELDLKRTKRITDFFEGLDAGLYRTVISNLKEHIDASLVSNGYKGDLLAKSFMELVRPRESVLRFGEVRVGITEDPQKELTRLYDYYIRKNFATKEYIETKIEKQVRAWLTDANLARKYAPRVIGDEIYEVNFPFVRNGNFALDGGQRIIKPLNFNRSTPSSIIDLGGKWTYRLKKLRSRGFLINSSIMFTVAQPESGRWAHWKSFKLAREELRNSGVEIVQRDEREKILQFASGS